MFDLALLIICVMVYVAYKMYKYYIPIQDKYDAIINNRKFTKIFGEIKEDVASPTTDCVSNVIRCIDDSDCAGLCERIENTNYKKFVCNKSKCVLETRDIVTDCDESLGFFPVLQQTEFEVGWSCLNTLPWFFDDNRRFRNHICNGGTMRTPFDITNNIYRMCTCTWRSVLSVRDDRKTIPICVPSNIAHLFPSYTEA